MISKKFFKSKEECEITFEYDGNSADKVQLVASANDWQPINMKKRKKDGVFYTRLRHPNNSQVQFRYLLDGTTWVNEPEADALVANEHGTKNGVIDTTPSN
jgi:1,4-alpha-glucan branching enzyme